MVSVNNRNVTINCSLDVLQYEVSEKYSKAEQFCEKEGTAETASE